MVNLGCQDADWLGTHDKEGLDAILLPDGLILSLLLYESYPTELPYVLILMFHCFDIRNIKIW